ncbi:hypothetical protein C8J57DRAFT_1506662 [Mycena rebaudengoi]|nr:hypothetical protein C8J57DRAFT_1506662 [Mycena rebaudengoi]
MSDRKDVPLEAPIQSPTNTRLLRGPHKRFLPLLFTSFILGIWIFVPLPTTPKTSVLNVAHDPRLDAYQSPDGAEYCAEWHTPTGSKISTISIDLLQGADLLFFLSRGPVAGNFIMDRKTNYSDPGVPRHIKVEVATEDQENLKQTKVCRVANDARNERGVLIWVNPKHPHEAQRALVNVNITVAVPLNIRSHKDLTTDLSMFAHNIIGSFADWWSPTFFRDLRFKSSNAPIVWDGFNARSAFIQTSNAEVQGELDPENKVHIQTSNAAVRCSVWKARSGSESEIKIITSHGSVEALLLTDETLKASIHTSHAPVTLIASTGANCSLHLNVSTSDAPVSVLLDPGYQGTFDLRTTLARAEVEFDPDAKDPYELGRQRTLQRTIAGAHTKGYTYWSRKGEPWEEGKSRGTINVRSSRSNVTMYLCDDGCRDILDPDSDSNSTHN